MDPVTVGQFGTGPVWARSAVLSSDEPSHRPGAAAEPTGADMPVDELTTTVEESDTAAAEVAAEAALVEPALVETELLVEEVSIDGMCGVY
jgi:mycofactocin precursor